MKAAELRQKDVAGLQTEVKELLRYYDPITHYFLFEASGEAHEMPRPTPDTTRRLM